MRRASGFGGEAFRGVGRILGFRERFVLSCGVWGSWGGFGLSCFRGASGFRGEDLGFRGDLRFRGGGRAFVRRDSGLSNRFYESKASGSPLETNRFCESNRFYEISA